MHDAAAAAAAQKTYYVSCSMKCGGSGEMWHGHKPQQYIEQAGGGAGGGGGVRVGVSHFSSKAEME